MPSASGTGWEDDTKNLPSARCLLQNVRRDRNRRKPEARVRVYREGKKGRGAIAHQSQEMHVCSILWGRQRSTGLLGAAQYSQGSH